MNKLQFSTKKEEAATILHKRRNTSTQSGRGRGREGEGENINNRKDKASATIETAQGKGSRAMIK